MVGQRLHMDDLIGMLLQLAGKLDFAQLFLRLLSKKEHIPIGPGRWHLRRVDDLLHPEQQSRDFLEVFVPKTPKPMPRNISKVRSRLAAS